MNARFLNVVCTRSDGIEISCNANGIKLADNPTAHGLESLRRSTSRVRAHPENMGIARPAESFRIHDMHRLEPDTQGLTRENRRDLGLQTLQQCHRRLHRLVPRGVERHDAQSEMEPSGVDDDRGVEARDGWCGLEERRLECVDCIAQGFVVALGVRSTSRDLEGSVK